ncbi:MAG: carbamoyltransferase N-terminal domain-containing protein, partial [Acidobacteriota bacterium]
MNVLGLSAFYHDSACCLLQHGRLVAAASEERFSRVKHDARLPVDAFRYCLKEGGIGITELDALAYYESPALKLSRQLWSGPTGNSSRSLAWLDPGQPERAIRERLGYSGRLLRFEHHHSHAASAFYYSGFPEAALLSADGVGEWATTSYGTGGPEGIEIFEEVHFPHSLGLLYSTITSYLGFRVNDGEYKVMGLAPYGQPRFLAQMQGLLQSKAEGQFELDLRYFDFVRGNRMFSEELPELLGQPARQPGQPLEPFHADVARSLQLALEQILLEKAAYLHRKTSCPDLCMAGGVALNCVANGRILREGPFRRLFVQPAAGDAGASLGAAALAYLDLTGKPPAAEPLRDLRLGPAWTGSQIAQLISATGIEAQDFRGRLDELAQAVAGRLQQNQVVAWFQGRMEFGPRALGARSLLANPLDPEIRRRLNRIVKKREGFRPFAPSVLADEAGRHFELDHPSPFMLETCQVSSQLKLPGITHQDGSARPQTVDPETHPRFAALLRAFEGRTGCPILLNTSFNLAGEPIVRSPVNALFCFGMTEIDALALGDFLIDRAALPSNWKELLPAWPRLE